MKYLCRTLKVSTTATDLETKLNQIAGQGWTCVGIVPRAHDLLVIFGGDFANIGALAIATQLLDSVL
jgi:hypothetical protein